MADYKVGEEVSDSYQLSEYWQEWVRDEANHYAISEEKLIERALKFFQDALTESFEKTLLDAQRPLE